MADKKLTTEEILAKLRKQDSGAGGGDAAADPTAESPVEPAVPVEGAAESPAAEAPKPAAAKPKSTADILAAARTQASGGGKAPAAKGESAVAAKGASPPVAKPSSTADILAAARGGAKAKPASGAKPSATADILAAARAQKAGAGGGDGGLASPAPKANPAAKQAAAPVVGDRPSVAEMVKAAREGKAMEAEAAKAAKPRLPAKPPLPKVKAAKGDPDRRGFLVSAITALCTPYYLAWTLLATIGAVWSLAVARFMMPNMIVEPPTKFKIGPPSDYPMGTVSTKWKAERGIWVVHTDSYDGRNLIYALASVCTHLGCTPNWLSGEQKFKCPCHGSGFYINGINFEGPAPRPLERVGLRQAEDGSLEVDKSVKFQEELGQWEDPSSFVAMA